MIAKAVKGKGFRGALEYDLGKEHGRVIDTNMEGRDPRELAAEFGEIRKLRPGLGKAVLHVSLSAAPGERLTDEQWCAIGQRYLQGMGLNQNQYLITRHTDTEHEHVHLLANRIRFAGAVTSDSHDYRRQEALMREIERDFHLQQVLPSRDVERRAATKGEIEHGLRTGEPSTRQQLQQLCDAAATGCRTFTEYADRLEAAGVDLLPVTQLDGAKLSGLSYRLDGVTMKGSDLGKRYSPAGLAKHGVSYDKERDLEAVGRCIERSQAGGAGEADRTRAPGEARQRGATGVDARAAGPGDGRADGRNPADAGRDPSTEPGTGREIPGAGRISRTDVAGRGNEDTAGRRTDEPGWPARGMEQLPPGVSHGIDYSDARERILALAGAADSDQPAGRQGGGRAPEVRDRSREAVERQIGAIQAERFDVLLRNDSTGQSVKRTWTKPELMKGVPWLKRMNAKGNDVYIRPTGQHGVILIDGLKAENVSTMWQKGFEPAVTVESRPGVFQAWVTLSNKSVSDQARQLATTGLAKAVTGAHAGPRNGYGRLAGFTFYDGTARASGKRRFVLAHGGWKGPASNGSLYLEHIDRARRERAIAQSRRELILPTRSPNKGRGI
jgi:hypothetical protein